MNKILLFLLPFLALCACKGSDDPDSDPVVSNIVTYEATTADGSVSTFSFQVVDDSPLITISANWKAPDNLLPGTRLLAYYSTSNPNESGPVELKQLLEIPGGEPTDTTDIANIPGENISLKSLWRSGNFLNLNASVNFFGNASKIQLLVDSSTLNRPTIESFILIVADSDAGVSETTVSRSLIASWDIQRLWELPSTQTLSVSFRNFDGSIQNMKFHKSN